MSQKRGSGRGGALLSSSRKKTGLAGGVVGAFK
jgi:hypothetical protein